MLELLVRLAARIVFFIYIYYVNVLAYYSFITNFDQNGVRQISVFLWQLPSTRMAEMRT